MDGLLALDVDALDAALEGRPGGGPGARRRRFLRVCRRAVGGGLAAAGHRPLRGAGRAAGRPDRRPGRRRTLPGGIDEALAAAGRLAARTHEVVSALGIDTGTYAEAGATPTQQLATMLATGRQVLDAVTDGGLEPDQALAQPTITVALDADIWGGIALLRPPVLEATLLAAGASEAAAAAWYRIDLLGDASLAGPVGEPAARHRRHRGRRAGGAESITVAPFDASLGGHSDGFARRMARNTQLLAQEESGLTGRRRGLVVSSR